MDRRCFLKGTAVAGSLAWASPLSADERDSSPLPTRPLGSTGVKVTQLALGGYTGMKEPRSDKFDPVQLANAAIDCRDPVLRLRPVLRRRAVRAELRRGARSIAARRCFWPLRPASGTYDGAMREFEESLKRLRTDHVDLLQIHGARVGRGLWRLGASRAESSRHWKSSAIRSSRASSA